MDTTNATSVSIDQGIGTSRIRHRRVADDTTTYGHRTGGVNGHRHRDVAPGPTITFSGRR